MRTIRFDSVGGASGDMILAALIDLGVDRVAIETQVASLHGDPFELKAEKMVTKGIQGTRVTVRTTVHEGHGAEHHHRRLADILHLIENSTVPPRAQEMSRRVFQRLAEAEAKVHGTTPDRIHFHEVGAMDSIVDIVGACVALDRLDVGRVEVGPLPLGNGTTRCAHGVLPVPVPATVELLKGAAVERTDEPFELVTPTGAALLSTWTAEGGTPETAAGGQVIVGTGYGIGHRELNHRANVLRAMLLEAAPADGQHDTCFVLECNLDDTVPELMGSLTERLLARGALDVFTTAVQMKKQRPGTLLTVLCHAPARDALMDLIFRESTTLGIRVSETARTVLARRHETVETPYGAIRIKIGTWRGEDITRAPEHDDCHQAATLHGVSVRAVYESAMQAAAQSHQGRM